MFLGMQDFDIFQIKSNLSKSKQFYLIKSLLGDVAALLVLGLVVRVFAS